MAGTDKRSVATDALETLGTIIDSSAGRDAIHLAVEPVVAGHPLRPGEDVGFMDDGTVGISKNPVGIVDPFLKAPVQKGERFWLVVYPRQITSLRHVWTHPAFGVTSPNLDLKPSEMDPSAASRAWIEAFAVKLDQTYNRVMEAAKTFAEYGEYTFDNSETYKDHREEFPEFWKHYEIVTGKEAPKDASSFFTCSC